MKKIFAAVTMTFILLITTAIGNFLVRPVGANPYFHGGYDPSPPINAKITIISPTNYTTYPSNLTLNFNVSFVNLTGVDYSVYLESINYTTSWETENKKVYKWNYYDEYNLDPSNDDPQISEYQYEENLTNIPEGKQKITIDVTASGGYIEAWTRYYFYINESTTVDFTVGFPYTFPITQIAIASFTLVTFAFLGTLYLRKARSQSR
jgi:hypothetical protein